MIYVCKQTRQRNETSNHEYIIMLTYIFVDLFSMIKSWCILCFRLKPIWYNLTIFQIPTKAGFIRRKTNTIRRAKFYWENTRKKFKILNEKKIIINWSQRYLDASIVSYVRTVRMGEGKGRLKRSVESRK